MDRSQRRALNKFLTSSDYKRREQERLKLEEHNAYLSKEKSKKRFVENVALCVVIIIISLIVTMLNGCKVVKNNEQNSEVRSLIISDSLTSKVADKKVVTEKTETKPESNLHIIAPVNVDSNGKVKDGEYRVNTGSDSLILVFKNNLVNVRSNCSKQVNFWKSEVHKRDSLLSIKNDSSSTLDKKKEVLKETVIEVIPRWIIWLVVIETSLLICFLYIKLRKYIP